MAKTKFLRLVWCCTILAVVWIVAGPLVREQYARIYWMRVPCQISETGRFLYVIQNNLYLADRRDFWQTQVWKNLPRKLDVPVVPNAECFVNPHDHEDAVLRLDALSNLQNGFRQYAMATLFLMVASGCTIYLRMSASRQRDKSQHSRF